MKSSELHRLILRNGWTKLRQRGSHITYIKDGVRFTAPYHGSEEVASGTARKVIREMGLK